MNVKKSRSTIAYLTDKEPLSVERDLALKNTGLLISKHWTFRFKTLDF